MEVRDDERQEGRRAGRKAGREERREATRGLKTLPRGVTMEFYRGAHSLPAPVSLSLHALPLPPLTSPGNSTYRARKQIRLRAERRIGIYAGFYSLFLFLFFFHSSLFCGTRNYPWRYGDGRVLPFSFFLRGSPPRVPTRNYQNANGVLRSARCAAVIGRGSKGIF